MPTPKFEPQLSGSSVHRDPSQINTILMSQETEEQEIQEVGPGAFRWLSRRDGLWGGAAQVPCSLDPFPVDRTVT